MLFGALPSFGQSLDCAPGRAHYPCYYVADDGDDGNATLKVVDSTTNQLVGNVFLNSSSPQGMAVTPDNAFVYVANQDDETVSIVKASTGSVTTVIDQVSGSPVQLAIAPSGAFVYVVGPGPNQGFVNVFDGASHQLIGGTTGLTQPTAVAIAPNGAFAYVADVCNGVPCVDVFDTTTHTETSPIPIPGTVISATASVAVSPDSSLVCMSVRNGAGNVAIALIDASSGTLLNTLVIANSGHISNQGLAITPGGILYAAVQPSPGGTPGTVIPVTLSSQTVGDSIAVGNTDTVPPVVAMGASGTLLYVTNPDDDTVSVINTGTNSVASTVGVQISPRGIASMSLAPPIITTQPVGNTINPGETLTLSVVASPTPLAYQWFQGQSGDTSKPIAGATGNQFTTPALTVTTSYWVLVSNIAGGVDSATATVTVNQPPACTVAVQGAAPPDFLTITANVNCVDPQGSPLSTLIDWNDGTTTSTDGGTVSVSHTYAQPGLYFLMITGFDQIELESTVQTNLTLPGPANPLVVIAGGTVTTTLTIQGAPAGLAVVFLCTTVTDSQNNVRQASDLGITCNSIPQQVTLTGSPQAVTIAIHTTGVGSSLVPARHGSFLYALWLPLPALVLLGARIRNLRSGPRAVCKYLALSTLLILALLSMSCSSGGFTTPGGAQGTPPGNYQITVIDQPSSGTTTGFVQSSLIVPLTVE